MDPLDGKVAIVTGASQGIGRAIALELAHRGAAVVVNDLSKASAAGGAISVEEEIRDAGGNARTHLADVSLWATGTALVRDALDAFGRLDIIVNNAGIIRDAMSFNMTDEQWDAVIDVHLKGHFGTCRAAARYWRREAKAGVLAGGRIINTSSESGLYGSPGQANYAAAKAGIAALTLVLARELRRYDVTVNTICPRARTSMSEHAFGAIASPEGEFDPWDPANVAAAVAWLASPEACDITGSTFVVVGNSIHVMQGWRTVDVVTSEARWTHDELTAMKHRLQLNGALAVDLSSMFQTTDPLTASGRSD